MSEWGPWVEHDGKGCPCLGMVVETRYRNGGGKGPYIAGTGGNPIFVGDPGMDLWVHLPKPNDVVLYRIRKPRGLTILENLIADLPAPTRKVDA